MVYFSNPFGLFTSTTTNSLLQSTGYTDSDLFFNFDAGSFINNYTSGQLSGVLVQVISTDSAHIQKQVQRAQC